MEHCVILPTVHNVAALVRTKLRFSTRCEVNARRRCLDKLKAAFHRSSMIMLKFRVRGKRMLKGL